MVKQPRHSPAFDQPLSAILSQCQQMAAKREIPDLLAMIVRSAATLLESEGASILLYDRERCELWSQVTLDGVSIRFDARLGIAGSALMNGTVINVSNAQEDTRFYDKIDQRTKKPTQSILAIPLKTNAGEPLGVFSVLNKKSGIFTHRDQEIGEALATQAALALETEQMVQALQQQHAQLSQENAQLWREMEERPPTQELIGTSLKMQNVVRLIDQIRDSLVDVLITGESGTGKELVARAIHYSSLRARRPFLALNCAALPGNLLESELFGIERGVATGVDQRVGRFEQADGGTLFLDEIGDLSLEAQAKILRALQERVLERVGGRTSIPLDVRIISATNKDLEAAFKKGTFREDLYFRLKIIHIQTPALREIPEDIPLLATYFLNKYCQEMGKDLKKFSSSAMLQLQSYHWPGNTRELEHEAHRLVVMVRRPIITERDLEETIQQANSEPGMNVSLGPQPLKVSMNTFEKRVILEALEACQFHQIRTAEKLGISRQGLIKKLRRYKIKSSSRG